MNMFHTGLGIARSLAVRGVPVIGLTAQKGVYGNFTRYARIVHAPNSRTEPEALLPYLLKLGQEIGPSVIFPTRDDDVIFLDRFRDELQKCFRLVTPESPAVKACLNKWETHQWAQKAGVPTPRCWLIQSQDDLERVIAEVTYPCVVKPVSSFDWHRGKNWQLVGGRKVLCVATREELETRYALIGRADKRVLLEEVIEGSDDALVIAACYLDRESNFIAGFNTQKVLQIPEGFGTGCVVQTANRPELFGPTVRLLQQMRFHGIAEVEYKWDAKSKEHKLIEINARPWDQHRLGYASGTDLIYLAYCEHAGLPITPATTAKQSAAIKWIEEESFVMTCLELLWRRDSRLKELFRAVTGKRIYSIWFAKDPLPFIVFVTRGLLPRLFRLLARALRPSGFGRMRTGKLSSREGVPIHENHLEHRKSNG